MRKRRWRSSRADRRVRRGTVEAAVRTALESLPGRDVRTAVSVLDALARAMER